MLRRVEVAVSGRTPVILHLASPETTGIAIRGISGIGSGATDLKMTDFASLPGSIYSGDRRPTRNIVFDLIIMGQTHRTVEQIRHASEVIFPIGEVVRLTFVADGRSCFIDGVVESNEPDIFSDEDIPGIPCQVSIVCADPRFFDIEPQRVTTYGVATSPHVGYVFPVKKPSQTVGVIDDAHAIVNIDYDGTSREGMKFVFTFTTGAKVHRIRISSRNSNNDSDLLLQLLPKDEESLFREGDVLTIDTTIGNKKIVLRRGNVDFNYLNFLDSMETVWPYLVYGNNRFNIIMNGGIGSAVKYNVDIYNSVTYWSV